LFVDEVQGFVVAAVPVPFNCSVDPTQTLEEPEIEGELSTVKVTESEHPFFVKVIVVVPDDNPVTLPELVTVATLVLEDDQVPPLIVGFKIKFELEPSQILNVPVILGIEFTLPFILKFPFSDPDEIATAPLITPELALAAILMEIVVELTFPEPSIAKDNELDHVVPFKEIS
jgi:hypothetical protein